MSKCAVCEGETEYWFLFMPSNVAVYLCTKHMWERTHDDSSIPIKEWVDSKKADHKKLMDYLLNLKEKVQDKKLPPNTMQG